MRDHRYIEIPGSKTHELPPLLVHRAEHPAEGSGDLSSVMPEAEEMLAAGDAREEDLDRRKFDLAIQLFEQYHGLVAHWLWGDSVLEWIRQCEITFEYEAALRQLLRPDVWPHAGRSSFVTLLQEKHVPIESVELERAVGLRLAFRQPPPIGCISSQFLLYLNSSVAESAYQTWAHLATREPGLFPPERFHFEVLSLDN